MPSLYLTLFEISSMRDEVSELRAEVSDAEAARLMARLDSVERTASRLLERVETRRKVVGH